MPAPGCSPAGWALPGLLPAHRPARTRREDTDVDSAVAGGRSRPGPGDADRQARLRRATTEGPGQAAARRPPAPPISPHLIAPGQGVLFGARRDWSCFAKGTLDQLPSLTPAAQALLEDFRQHVEARGLDEQVRRIAARSLRILLAWPARRPRSTRPISGPCP